MLRDNFPLPVDYTQVSGTQLQSHTSLPPPCADLSAIEAVPLISRACQSTSSHSPRFAPVDYLPYLTLPYLSQGWAKIHRSHSHSTPHPGAQRQSSSRLALSASQNCNLSTNPLPVSHADCQLNLFSTSSDHWNRVNRIYNCRAGRTLICRCLHRVNRVHHCRHHFPLDPALVVLTISLTQLFSTFFAISTLANSWSISALGRNLPLAFAVATALCAN